MAALRARAVAGLAATAAAAWLLAGCTSVSAAVPAARALMVDEKDPSPLRSGPDEVVVEGLVIDARVPPRVDLAISTTGTVLAAWMDGPDRERTQVVVALVEQGTHHIVRLARLTEPLWSHVDVGFGADGSAVVAWDGDNAPQAAGVSVLAPGATEWSPVRSFGEGGAERVSLDPADARRIAVVGRKRTARWRLLLDPVFYLPLVDSDHFLGPETTVGVADAGGGVRAGALRPRTRGIAILGCWIAGRTARSAEGGQRVVYVRDIETGDETALEVDARFDDIGLVDCGGTPVAAWGGSTGLVVCERGSGGWATPVRLSPVSVGKIRIAASGESLLVTMSAGGDVRAWLRRGGRWSGPVKLRGWSGVPAFDRGQPVVFRVVDSTGASGSADRQPTVPAAGKIVSSRIR